MLNSTTLKSLVDVSLYKIRSISLLSLISSHIPQGSERKDQLLCNVVPVYAYPEDSAKYTSPDENCIIVNRNDDDKSQIVFILSGRSTEERALQAILVDNPRKMIYKRDKEVTTPINLSILSNSCNTIKVQTPVTLDCTHKVSLNSKSQIEELQEVAQKEKKSIWQKIKELTDIKYSFRGPSYMKLPTAMGGIIVQWGITPHINTKEMTEIALPISFNSPMIALSTLVGGSPTGALGTMCMFVGKGKISLGHSYSSSRELYWLCIGR